MAAKHPLAQGATFFAIFFVGAFAVEALLFVAVEKLFNTHLIPRGFGWVFIPISAGLAGWAFGQEVGVEGALKGAKINLPAVFQTKQFRAWAAGSTLWGIMIIAVFLIFDPFNRYHGADWRDEQWEKFLLTLFGPPIVGLIGIYLFDWALSNSDIQETTLPAKPAPQYKPSATAYQYILWSLIALSVIDGNIDDRKIQWIEIFHEHIQGVKLKREDILNMAKSLIVNGPTRIKDLLLKNRDQIDVKDREILIKSCCLLAANDGRMSAQERDLILDIAANLEISKARLGEL
jgi:hypothetical protein